MTNEPHQSPTQTIYPITGKIFSSPYDWGGKDLIPSVLGFTPEENTPYAEYWIGAHPKAPAQIAANDGTTKPITSIIEQDPKGVLGEKVAETYGSLPFLFKLLDAKKMLSIQVHPTLQQARDGYAAEEQAGIPLTDNNRTYKDANPKTEFAVALADFWLLHGLRKEEEITTTLESVKEFNSLIPAFSDRDYKKLYTHILFELSDEEANTILRALANRIIPPFDEGRIEKTSPDYWAAKAIKDFSMLDGEFDRGLFSIYFLNIVNMKPGQAILQEAGVIHSYLNGPIIEVMQASDNVVRAGITNKPINFVELLKLMRFQSQTPQLIEGRNIGNETFFDTNVDEFLVSKITFNQKQSYSQKANYAEVIIGMEGNATISSNSVTLPLNKGKSIFVSAGASYEIHGSENDTVYRTSIPLK